MKFLSTILFILLLSTSARAALSVFAAASTTDAMKDLAAAYKDAGGETVRFNFASSGSLARQIEAGAPADVFVSANVKWMDWLEAKAAIQTASRFNLAANTLVLTAPPGASVKFDGTVPGKVAVGELKSVPAGMYAKEALEHLGWFSAWKPHFVQASSVRTALLYVQRGEVSAGIVYATDARAAGLPILGTFPPESHSPIIYPAAAVSEKESAVKFLHFLKSDEASRILKSHGFTEAAE
ncbi:molybdate ABC transporter substrate-binding protein [Pontiella agarivorans]|uniref:Molybdate ABC transporter substrate-binding protein n=1 Tax=Pontiella agarivorans TaxID=3038953 RepID=A0ABU5MYU2_9BACT|nr:molybdate ABC transporter substrate-binding protein [Pontiella agarivorans]MDZ8119359.1 molybdate ABC transporter substrate-binding protein [Pontiella agarivorans]